MKNAVAPLLNVFFFIRNIVKYFLFPFCHIIICTCAIKGNSKNCWRYYLKYIEIAYHTEDGYDFRMYKWEGKNL